MPFKSQAQRAWMFANHPKMAKRWASHTLDSDLPDRADEDVQTEMPHFDSDSLGLVDLRIERYPMPAAGKNRLMKQFSEVGLVGLKNGRWYHFKPDHTVEEITSQQAQDLPKLPSDWDRHAVVGESYVPSMLALFNLRT